MNWRSVSSKSLRRRRVEIDGLFHRGAAVLPFFNGEGRVAFCMIVLPRASRLFFFSPEETGPRVPPLGTIRLERPLWSWSDGSYVPELAGLWHYDPDWLLRDARFAGLEVIPALRKTNCCSKLPPDVTHLNFGRDLTRVRSVSRGKDEQARRVPITDVLPAASPEPDEPRVAAPPRGWRLDPAWMRSSR